MDISDRLIDSQQRNYMVKAAFALWRLNCQDQVQIRLLCRVVDERMSIAEKQAMRFSSHVLLRLVFDEWRKEGNIERMSVLVEEEALKREKQASAQMLGRNCFIAIQLVGEYYVRMMLLEILSAWVLLK